MKCFREKFQTMEKYKSRNYQQLKNYESRTEKVAQPLRDATRNILEPMAKTNFRLAWLCYTEIMDSGWLKIVI